MRLRWLSGCLIGPVLLLAFAPGCQALHRYRSVAILATDAETHKPIPGAEVRISYPLTQPHLAPWDSAGTTGDDGIARLRAAPYGDAGILVEVHAKGYLFEQKNLSVADVQALEPVPLLGHAEQRPAPFVLELFAAPRPSVELVVPTGFRGLVKVAVQVKDDAPQSPGQRTFRYLVPPSGDVLVTGPPLLRRVFVVDFGASYADGTPLPRSAKGEEPAFWWTQYRNGYDFFLVGTWNEYAELRRDLEKEGAGPGRTPQAGKGQGKGRHNRGGNQPPADNPPPAN
jgi:hypothetical protein